WLPDADVLAAGRREDGAHPLAIDLRVRRQVERQPSQRDQRRNRGVDDDGGRPGDAEVDLLLVLVLAAEGVAAPREGDEGEHHGGRERPDAHPPNDILRSPPFGGPPAAPIRTVLPCHDCSSSTAARRCTARTT